MPLYKFINNEAITENDYLIEQQQKEKSNAKISISRSKEGPKDGRNNSIRNPERTNRKNGQSDIKSDDVSKVKEQGTTRSGQKSNASK